jgi:hypothetical protein
VVVSIVFLFSHHQKSMSGMTTKQWNLAKQGKQPFAHTVGLTQFWDRHQDIPSLLSSSPECVNTGSDERVLTYRIGDYFLEIR